MIKYFKKILKRSAQLPKRLSIFFPILKKPYHSILDDRIISIRDIFYQHEQNVSDKWVNYFDIYDECFNRHIGNNSNVLEIGVQNGGFLQILSKYLKNATLYGVDIDPTAIEICRLRAWLSIIVDVKDIKKITIK